MSESVCSINPHDGQVVAVYPMTSMTQIEERLGGLTHSFSVWRTRDLDTRAAILRNLAVGLRRDTVKLARLMATEMGKPVRQGRAEAEKCALVCEHYADRGAEYLAPEPVDVGDAEAAIIHRPLGPLLAIMPWNFPLWQLFRFAAPNFMAGNTVLLKHASNVTGCAMAIEALCADSGAPGPLLHTVVVGNEGAAALCADPRIRGVTLTGSTRAGRAVAAAAGAALKPAVLELGGSDPYVVLADADIEAAAKTCAQSRMQNTGQSCIAAKRLIVETSVHDAFVECLEHELATLRRGDPLDESADLGPMARVDLRDQVHEQVVRTRESGAQVVLGGFVPEGAGAHYPATLLVDVPEDSAAGCEEVFGPVASVLRARDAGDALRIANDTVFGLGAAVFTRDIERGRALASDVLEAGCCFVNTHVRSDPRVPFGGIGHSGFGRELGRAGMLAFTNCKTVWVQ